MNGDNILRRRHRRAQKALGVEPTNHLATDHHLISSLSEHGAETGANPLQQKDCLTSAPTST